MKLFYIYTMKFIKKFESHKATSKEVIPIETLFTDDEFSDIKDLYRDLVEDLNLTSVDRESDMTTSLTSKLSTWWKNFTQLDLNGISNIDISIRTADLIDYTDYNSYVVPSKEDRERYNLIMKELQPFIDTLKSMGYEVNKGDIDYKLDSWKYVTAGIKISITK